MNTNTRLDDLLRRWETGGQLMPTIEAADRYMREESIYSLRPRLERISADYGRMLDYMGRGVTDPERGRLYAALSLDMYALIQDLRLAHLCQHSGSYREAARIAAAIDDTASIRQTLETYVSEQAMLTLLPPGEAEEGRLTLARQHDQYLDALFAHVLVSPAWQERDRQFWTELLMSPTIDSADAQTLVGALMLATVNLFDLRRLQTLAEVCLRSADTDVRQRALVGCLLALSGGDNALMREATRAVARRLTASQPLLARVVEAQRQIIYCLDAEDDSRTVQQEIMPTLIRGNRLMSEERDPLQAILDPQAEEREAEEIERRMEQMRRMEREGKDVYLSGFRHMKRFSFFYKIAHWFEPFSPQHPALSDFADRYRSHRQLIDSVMAHCAFCSSDRYSFFLTFVRVVDQIPTAVTQALGSAEAGEHTALTAEMLASPACKRRMFLQDVYRFYTLYTAKDDFRNPFADTASLLPLASGLFQGCGLEQSEDCQRMMGDYCRRQRQTDRAITHYRRLLHLRPDMPHALRALARCLMEQRQPREAMPLLERLAQLCPDSTVARLNLCVCQTACGEGEAALTELYRMHYEQPQNTEVTRVLAWTLMDRGKYPQAMEHYRRLMESEEARAEDWLNGGYCLWLAGHAPAAVDALRRWQRETATPLADALAGDADFLSAHGVTATGRRLLCDIVERKGD